MRLYIASHSQDEALELMAQMISAGHEITARWITEDEKFHLGPDGYADRERQQIASMDVEDVQRAVDGVVLVAEKEDRCVPGGKHVEAGIAIGLGRPVYVLGRRENILYWHPSVRAFNDAAALLAWLALS